MKKEPLTSKKPIRKSATAAPRLRRRTTPKVTAVVAAPESIPPAEADVARRAYEIFLSRNGEPGDPVSDWLQAEQELRPSI